MNSRFRVLGWTGPWRAVSVNAGVVRQGHLFVVCAGLERLFLIYRLIPASQTRITTWQHPFWNGLWVRLIRGWLFPCKHRHQIPSSHQFLLIREGTCLRVRPRFPKRDLLSAKIQARTSDRIEIRKEDGRDWNCGLGHQLLHLLQHEHLGVLVRTGLIINSGGVALRRTRVKSIGNEELLIVTDW